MEYDRTAAVEYAHNWAYLRNPAYGKFDEMGGDCTNFVSQCLYAGCGVMNESPDTGWYYHGMSRRSPAWTGVAFLRRFLLGNKGSGPYGEMQPVERALPGDVVLIAFENEAFSHACVVVAGGARPARVLVAAHTMDCDMRPLDTYAYQTLASIRILGFRGPA